MRFSSDLHIYTRRVGSSALTLSHCTHTHTHTIILSTEWESILSSYVGLDRKALNKMRSCQGRRLCFLPVQLTFLNLRTNATAKHLRLLKYALGWKEIS